MKIRIISNAHRLGGGEMSVGRIMTLLCEQGHDVMFHPTSTIGRNFPFDCRAKIGPPFPKMRDARCDVLFYYANNFCLQTARHKDRWLRCFDQSARKVMCLNWDLGDSAIDWFAEHWDSVGFLCTALRDRWVKATYIMNREKTWVHAPCVDLRPFMKIPIDRVPTPDDFVVVRHGKRVKWGPETPSVMCLIHNAIPGVRFDFMGCPERLIEKAIRLGVPPHKIKSRAEFSSKPEHLLEGGDMFLHVLKPDFTDQGPRVIVEAIAAGLWVIADARDGALDRCNETTGDTCSNLDEYAAAVKRVAAALENGWFDREEIRRLAAEAFNPNDWVNWITN